MLPSVWSVNIHQFGGAAVQLGSARSFGPPAVSSDGAHCVYLSLSTGVAVSPLKIHGNLFIYLKITWSRCSPTMFVYSTSQRRFHCAALTVRSSSSAFTAELRSM